MGSADDLDQGAFTRSVFTEQSQHLTFIKFKIYTIQGLHPGKTLPYAPHAEQRSLFGFSGQATSDLDPDPLPPWYKEWPEGEFPLEIPHPLDT